MTLTLRAVSLNDQPLTQPITAHFDRHGGTIGRADHNTLALPDPERHISREQAEIIAGMSGYVIRNVGSSNPIVVRDQSLAHGESAPLLHNDQLRIGSYLLEVVDDATAAGDAEATTRARAAEDSLAGVGKRASAAPSPMAALSAVNPFAELMATPGSPRLPEDFDLFAAPAPAPRPATSAGSFDDLIPASPGRSIDELFGLKGAAGEDPLAGFLSDSRTPSRAQRTPVPATDPLVLFGAAAEPAPPPEVAPDRSRELHAAFTPPRAQAMAAPQPQVQVQPKPVVAAVPVGADGPLWSAFCEGAGVDIAPPPGASPDVMRLAGALLRASIAGTLQLMAVRAATRHELHAQVTVIQARNNNPLKFSPDAQSALEQLLQPTMRGFLPGPAAVTEAMDDLVGHAIGTMAGTRSALEGVLSRFAPQELEAKLAGKTVLDSVLPMARKARLWELYLQHHQAIREEAQEDFHALFGKAFLAAYEQQLEQLRQERSRA